MATSKPIIIICAEQKIHKPKPKRINKKSNIFQYNKKCLYNNRQFKQRNSRMNYNEHKKCNMKCFVHDERNKNLSFNLDLISLEEINNDFKEFQSNNEDIEVQKELIDLIRKADCESCRNDCSENFQRIRRPQNPFCKNMNNKY